MSLNISNVTIVLTQPRGLLVRTCADGSLELPRVPISPDGRIAYEVTEYLHSAWNLNAVCLFAPRPQWSVLSVAGRVQDAPMGHSWITISEATRRLASQSQAELLKISLQQMAAYESGEQPGPFARAGWLEDLAKWAAPALGALGLSWTGRFRQFGGGPESSLLRLETNGAAVWFKGVSEPFRREYAITKHIAAHTPGVSPDVLSTSDEWRAWLMLEAEGCPLGNCHRLEAWVQAARKLATVQRSYVRAAEKLLALGAIDYRGDIVIEKLDDLCRRLPELMSRQPAGSRAPRLSRDELEALRCHVPLLCEAFFAVYVPITLVHGDPNADNFIIGPRGAMILDWAESYVSHPFLTYEYLRMHLNRTQPLEAPEWELELGDAYGQVWRPVLAERDIQDAFALVRLVAPLLVASRSLDRLDASHEREDEIPLLEAHIRSLARVAFRALQPLLVEVTA